MYEHGIPRWCTIIHRCCELMPRQRVEAPLDSEGEFDGEVLVTYLDGSTVRLDFGHEHLTVLLDVRWVQWITHGFVSVAVYFEILMRLGMLGDRDYMHVRLECGEPSERTECDRVVVWPDNEEYRAGVQDLWGWLNSSVRLAMDPERYIEAICYPVDNSPPALLKHLPSGRLLFPDFCEAALAEACGELELLESTGKLSQLTLCRSWDKLKTAVIREQAKAIAAEALAAVVAERKRERAAVKASKQFARRCVVGALRGLEAEMAAASARDQGERRFEQQRQHHNAVEATENKERERAAEAEKERKEQQASACAARAAAREKMPPQRAKKADKGAKK